MKQAVYFVPPDKRIAVAERPDHVWTLISREVTDPSKPPSLPLVPVCRDNAWPEDVIHDWSWAGGTLRYFSRVADHGVWILCEYNDAPKPARKGKRVVKRTWSVSAESHPAKKEKSK